MFFLFCVLLLNMNSLDDNTSPTHTHTHTHAHAHAHAHAHTHTHTVRRRKFFPILWRFSAARYLSRPGKGCRLRGREGSLSGGPPRGFGEGCAGPEATTPKHPRYKCVSIPGGTVHGHPLSRWAIPSAGFQNVSHVDPHFCVDKKPQTR